MAKIQELYLCGEEAYAHWEDVKTYGMDIFLNNVPYAGYGLLHDTGDFSHLPNLRKLGLFRVSLNDLSALKGLPLTHLGIGGNHITDISLLSSFPSLRELDISDNPVTSLAVLKSCPLLHSLRFGATAVSDLNPLRGLALDAVCLYDLPTDADISALASLTGLRSLEARQLPYDAVEPLLALKSLDSITLFFCGVDSLAPFADLPDLILLNLLGNNLTTLDGVQQLVKLRHLDITGNHLTSIDPLAGHPALESIRLANNPIEDLSPLEGIPTLTSVTLGKGQETLFSKPAEDLKFQILYDE
jgi:Leucine-rich repeat (LRR) protein